MQPAIVKAAIVKAAGLGIIGLLARSLWDERYQPVITTTEPQRTKA